MAYGIQINVNGTVAANIAAAAKAAFALKESTKAGPDDGVNACVWEVDRILERAGVAPLDPNVFNVQNAENELIASRGTLVSSNNAVPGDIIIQADDGHIGICVVAGCTTEYSNSSGNMSFSDSYGLSVFLGQNMPGRIYHLQN